MLAAGSLHRLQDRAQRDELLQKVLEPGRPVLAPVDEGARLLAAEWALDDRDATRALELLAQLPPGVGRRTQALRLKLLRRAADAFGLAVVSEVMDSQQVGLLARYSDILQIGARNMQNYALLREVGHIEKPVMIKRGLSSTIEEWLLSAEHVMAQGNRSVMLCERGIRTFETYTRNTLDLNAVPVVKELSHLPVIVDPSHGVGIRNKIAPMARAAVAARVRWTSIESASTGSLLTRICILTRSAAL